jgi:hypothetical protein
MAHVSACGLRERRCGSQATASFQKTMPGFCLRFYSALKWLGPPAAGIRSAAGPVRARI